MAMNFWEAQRRAKSKTSLYVTIFVLLTLTAATAAEFLMRIFSGEDYNQAIPYVGIFFVGITFVIAAFQYLQFVTYGGAYVAESLGARLVGQQSGGLAERQLMNIVQEIAVASSLPVPSVYILETNQINAFAAGTKPSDSAITVTRGCIEKLNRDELQGVVAHEFGHIYNGDMKISLRLAAMVMGFVFILYLAMRILQFSNVRRENQQKGNPIIFAAVAFLIVGAFTWLFGAVLKAAVSREREYLADACAVQFTRNPDGIANALKKILKQQDYDEMPDGGMAYSHLYFDNHEGISSIFATHPPLRKRIAAIEDREYIPAEWEIDQDTQQEKQK